MDREILAELIRQATDVSDRAGMSDLSARLAAIGDRLRDERVYVAVLGQFKRGKSTLVNALLGEEVLPSSVVPLTAVPTVLRHGEHRTVSVRFLDDRAPLEHHIEPPARLLDCVSGYVTEMANPENVLNVAQVEVRYPADLLATGLVLVDTPGIGSTLQHNTQATLNFLPECDAAIFVVSADPPLTEVERQFLELVRQRVERVFYVLTKADYLDSAERAELMRFVEGQLREHSPDGCRLQALSGRLALQAAASGSHELRSESGIDALEQDLTEFARSEMAEVLHSQVALRLAECLKEASDRLLLQRTLLTMPLDDLKTRSEQFRHELDGAVAERRVAHDLIAGDRRRLGTVLEEEAERLRVAARQYLCDALDGWDADDLEPVLAEHVPPYFERALGDFTAVMSERLESALRVHQQRADAIIARVSELAADLFSIEYTAPPSDQVFESRREPYWVAHEWQISAHLAAPSAMERALPRGLRDRRRRRRLRAVVDHLVTNNVENVRWAVLQNINDSIARYAGDLDRRLAQTAEDIERAISEATARRIEGAGAVQEHLERLDDRLQEVDRLAERVGGLAPLQAARPRKGDEVLGAVQDVPASHDEWMSEESARAVVPSAGDR